MANRIPNQISHIVDSINAESRSSFGDALSADINPIITIKAVYGILDDVETFTASGGSATASNREFVVQSGTSVGGYGTIWSAQPVIYKAGLGCEARFTARFTAGIADSTQLAGLFSSADGMFFGYNGADFGVMHRYGGEFEVRTLTITAAATGATVAVTLNGVQYDVVVAASATVQEAAHDLEVALLASSANDSWFIQHIEDTIVFMFRGTGEKNGAYSISGDATLAGSFASTNAGASPTENWTTQANWDFNPSWLDTTKGNLYKVEFAYLGYGPLNYYIMDPNSKKWVLVHQIDWPNNNTTPNFGNPSLRVGWASASLGSSGTNLTVAGASGMVALQGRTNDLNRRFSAYGANTTISTEEAILLVEVRREFNGRACQAVVLPSVDVATDSQKGMVFRIYKNPSVAGDTLETLIDQAESVCFYDTAGTTVTGGRLERTIVVGPNGSRFISSKDLGFALFAGDRIVVTGEVTTGAQSGGFVTINTEEII